MKTCSFSHYQTAPNRVGSALFSGCSVADMDMEDMIKPILPFYAAIFVALMLVAYVPWFSMALPTLFGAV